MNFTREIQSDFIIEKVNLTRATLKDAEVFKNLIDENIKAGCRQLIIDLSDCEYIDSTFLGSLVTALKKIKNIDGNLKLVGFQPAVESMFELTRMYRIFETFKTREEAIKAIKENAKK